MGNKDRKSIETVLSSPDRGSVEEEEMAQTVKAILSKVAEADTMARSVAAGKDLVLVVGNTGAGKSTFLNYLIGKRMEEAEVPGSLQNGFRCESPVFEIGFGFESKTEFPQVYFDGGSGLTYCDCPGFNDNRGVEFDVSNMYAIARLVNSARAIKGVVMLLNYHSLQADRGRGIRETLDILRKLFGDRLSHCLSAIQVVVTCDHGMADLPRLRKFLLEGSDALNLPRELSSNAQLYDPLDRFGDRSRVSREGMVGILQRLTGLDKSDVRVVLPNDSMLALDRSLRTLMRKCEREMKEQSFEVAGQFLTIVEKLKILRVSEIEAIDREFQQICVREIRELSREDENLRLLQDAKVQLPWLEDFIDTEIDELVARVEEKKKLNKRVAVAEEDLELAKKEAAAKELAHKAKMDEVSKECEELRREAQRRKEEADRLRESQGRATHGNGGFQSNVDGLLLQLYGMGMAPGGGGYPMASPMGYPTASPMRNLDYDFSHMSLGSPSYSSPSSGGGTRRQYVNGYTRANGTQVKGYYRNVRK